MRAPPPLTITHTYRRHCYRHREAEARGYRFSAPIFFEKLALAGFAPGSIPDMAAFYAALRRPEVQAAYRADYESSNSNGKRGAILKIFEVAGVDTRLVKVGA